MRRILSAVGLSASILCPSASPLLGETRLEFGTASGEPGEIVEVPVLATHDKNLPFFAVVFTYDFDRLEYLRFAVEGTAAERADPMGVSYRTYGPGEAFCGIFATRYFGYGYRIPPGEDQRIGTLRFRIRASAAAGSARVAPERRVSGTAGGTTFDLEDPDGSLSSVPPDVLVAGSVEVDEPTRPRPVGDLVCEQFLDRARISFRLTSAYDAIEVARDGRPIAVLPGSSSSFEDALPGVGRFSYSLVARAGGASSIPAECEILAGPPAAPEVKELLCDGPELTWKNPVTYERITVFRDGDVVAQIPGDATSYRDPGFPGRPTLYTVLGELEGYRGPEVHCFSDGVWILEAGDVEVPLGAERILVPIYATTSMPVQGISYCIDIDMSSFTLIEEPELSFQGVAWNPAHEFFEQHFVGPGCAGPVAGLVYDMFPPPETDKDLPVGLRQHVLNFVFEPTRPFEDGETVPVAPSPGSSFMARYPSKPLTTIDARPTAVVPGEIRFGSGGLRAVADLEARVARGEGGGASGGTEVVLSWKNGAPYDAVRITRNGALLAEVSGSATAFTDGELPPGIFTYKVAGRKGEKTSFPASALVTTFQPPGAFLRGDANRDGLVNIADPVATLNFLFRGGAALPCDDAADANDDGRLNLTDPITTIQYLFLGAAVITAPGTRYPWFDPTPDGLTCRE